MKLFISPKGTVEGVYNDDIPRDKLGTSSIDRASNVEFNPNTNMWEATHMDGEFMVAAATRADCLELERNVVETYLEQQVYNL